MLGGGSAYFVSPYPIGSDAWAHKEYITYFIEYGSITVPSGFSVYHTAYPISHLFVVCTTLITSIPVHDAMFIWGVILAISTIAIFSLVKMLTGNVQVALMAMLLLNFFDAHIQWSVQTIATTFGIAIYSFIVFLMVKIYLGKGSRVHGPLLLLFLGVIVWVHTIGAFIALVSFFAFLLGIFLYNMIYEHKVLATGLGRINYLILPFIFLLALVLYHWTDPVYPFLDRVLSGLLDSLSSSVTFLGGVTLNRGQWAELFYPLGFCLYVFFGVVGALYCISHKERAKKYFPLVVVVFVLFLFRYGFPLLGLRNIIPGRWHVFAFVCLAMFVAIGLFHIISKMSVKTKRGAVFAATVLLLIGPFFMITDAAANHDSPLYGENVSLNMTWKESEMSMHTHINETYSGPIFADVHTAGRPFATYLKNNNANTFKLSSDGSIDTDAFSGGLVVWREDSITRPVHARYGEKVVTTLPGSQFLFYLNMNYNCVSATDSAKYYLPVTASL
ncbi:MAG: hypothetical protein PWQ62_300 [Candidatus Methanomethylophilaceae archaeon]|nr:hypothetical protein [Candidatus Methanomethylophilaceae archaeon]